MHDSELQKPRVLITTADFLPYTTPRRLVLSLQSDSDTKSTDVEKEDSVRLGVEELGEVAACNGDADMDVESSSDGGWSVREYAIASDESFCNVAGNECRERSDGHVLSNWQSGKVELASG